MYLTLEYIQIEQQHQRQVQRAASVVFSFTLL